ncbi:beta-methylmalyl-CoA/L-malyl-CoA lyase [Haloarcula vallismortis]|uniref:Citrate lyase beta subunit n=2 Tax=Haloarcula vallismortis TaxID=28442 RepID=M0JFA2_HALVA|nr:L-malyl-CoA/beta-methylmalyl-CoA lyase [Haloarcula vallismortis]EMA07013.1 citrate lyase beta subunit [Haloarcula vallismortis ATCC 29715]SDW55019.1 beta-methylmalyl-CoA/L-malyl-CoA lyase [Haloarcula vallismortis]
MTRLCRTFQTAPAAIPNDNSAKFLVSGLTSEGFQTPDWLVPDIEDGTAPSMKAEAVDNIIEHVPDHADEFAGEILPRVEWAYDDADARERGIEQVTRLADEVGEELDGFVFPKVGRLEDVRDAAGVIADAERDAGLSEGALDMAIILETAPGRSDLREICQFAADSRLSALVFGPVDYTAELGGRALNGERPRWDGLLEALSNETSAADIVSIGGPFDQLFHERAGVTYYNAEGYADQVEHEATIGIDGSWSLHPKQTTQANRIHMPTTEELERDLHKIESFNEAKREGTGAVVVDGQMVDEATYKNFANTVKTVRAIDDTHPAQTGEYYADDLLARARDVDLIFG